MIVIRVLCTNAGRGGGQVANLDIRFERALSAVEENLRGVEHPDANGS
ncbi:hypothetical protein AB0B56_19515 [Streptosporangium canum]